MELVADGDMLIYKITHKDSGKYYIGQTTNTLQQRWSKHASCPKNYPLHNAIRKYGKNAFTKEIIGTYANLDDLNNAEAYFIEYYNSMSPNGYNLTTGGEGYTVSEETKAKLSASHMGQVPSQFNREQSRKANLGKPTHNKGKTGYTNLGSFKKGITPWNKGKTKV